MVSRSHKHYTHALADIHKYHFTNYFNLSSVTCCHLLKNIINLSSYVCEDTTCSHILWADRSMCSWPGYRKIRSRILNTGKLKNVFSLMNYHKKR